MRIIAVFLFFLIDCAACTFITPATPITDTVLAKPENLSLDAGIHSEKTDTANLLTVHAWHLFSDSLRPDSFVLRLSGINVLKGRTVVTIYNSKHELLHTEIFLAIDMLFPTDKLSANQKEDSILARLTRFFEDSAFFKPVSADPNVFGIDESNKATWDEACAGKSSFGFIFSYYHEGYEAILYSRKLRKVVKYDITD